MLIPKSFTAFPVHMICMYSYSYDTYCTYKYITKMKTLNLRKVAKLIRSTCEQNQLSLKKTHSPSYMRKVSSFGSYFINLPFSKIKLLKL